MESATTGAAPSKGRRTAFRVIATIIAVAGLGFGLFTAVFGILSEAQRIHAFHNAVVATLLIVLSAPAAIAAARDPEESAVPLMHLMVLSIAGLLTMVLSLTIDPFTLPVIVLLGLLWVLRPTREPLLPAGRPSPVLLVLVLAAAVPLATYALNNAELQRIDDISEHAEFYHWVEMSFYAAAVLLLGLLAALRPAAFRLSAWTVGVALAVLGGASLLLPRYASSLDAPWAWAALGGSVLFVAVAQWERQRATG
jgi:hypothetical protein